jgi:UDP-4-amino-4,6-dideoxy-N-acetyl-beta-L-altrosamine N-acetyltransferase
VSILDKQLEQPLNQPERLEGYHICMRKMDSEDIELARQWRNLPHVRDMMIDTSEVSAEQQNRWFDQVCQRKDQWHFMIEYQNKPIGVANIKSTGSTIMVGSPLEIGLYIGEEAYRDNMIAFAPNLLLIDYCFEQLKLDELNAVVKKDNEKAIQYNYALGYRTIEAQPEVVKDNENSQENDNRLIKLKLTQEDYNISTKMLKAFL